jgi:signal-induced proliferation-associated 1 like protein 3
VLLPVVPLPLVPLPLVLLPVVPLPLVLLPLVLLPVVPLPVVPSALVPVVPTEAPASSCSDLPPHAASPTEAKNMLSRPTFVRIASEPRAHIRTC